MDEEQDDLTLVYMWAYKQAEKEYKKRIEELEAALRQIAQQAFSPADDDVIWMDDYTPLGQFIDKELASAELAGEKKDGSD